MVGPEVLRYAAFTTDPEGGNPAGVVLDARGMDDAAMLAVAAAVGYSETAFLVPGPSAGAYDVRYFSPLAEVPFCGHATIASAVALRERGAAGPLHFGTRGGLVPVVLSRDDRGRPLATLTSVEPTVATVDPATVDLVLTALRWRRDELDPALPPRVAAAGASHLVLAAGTRSRLADLDYDGPGLRALMEDRGWTTVHLVWRETPTVFHARDPFPVGGVVEDPATGAAAAAFGAYLRALGLIAPPARITILQGEDLGRPGLLTVDLAADDPRVRVTGAAVAMADHITAPAGDPDPPGSRAPPSPRSPHVRG